MSSVADKINVDLTRPGRSSQPHWGKHIGARYRSSAEYVAGTLIYKAAPRIPRLQLEATEDGYIASDSMTGVFGAGPDADQAVRDLAVALREHRDVLERQDALSPALQEQLEHLRDLF
ncbi:MAG TPA: hypothetical protein VHA80_04255 [Solirubrobacterales bacterium]|nr:hypothetical protein [Solirubrobacterales bacterium]